MPVAVKVIQPDMSSTVSSELEEKFTREVSMLSRVNHENIVKVCRYDYMKINFMNLHLSHTYILVHVLYFQQLYMSSSLC